MQRARRRAAGKVTNYAEFDRRGWQNVGDNKSSSSSGSSESGETDVDEASLSGEIVKSGTTIVMACAGGSQSESTSKQTHLDDDHLSESIRIVQRFSDEVEAEFDNLLHRTNSELDSEINRLEAENAELAKALENRERTRKLLRIRSENEKLRGRLDLEEKFNRIAKQTRVDSRRQSTPEPRSQSAEASTSGDDRRREEQREISHATLKDLDYLEKVAERVVSQKLGLGLLVEEQNQVERDNFDTAVGKVKKDKSGLRQVISDSKIVNPQLCPQECLRLEHVKEPLGYDDLDLRLFVAGEINIIDRDDIGQAERKGRLSLLKDILFLAGVYEWRGMLELYAAIINQIERGQKDWSSDFSAEKSLVLLKFSKPLGVTEKKSDSTDKERGSEQKDRGFGFARRFGTRGPSGGAASSTLWYCRPYQRGECNRSDPHQAWVFGRGVTVHHMCAKCYLADRKKVPHAESSESCPYNN